MTSRGLQLLTMLDHARGEISASFLDQAARQGIALAVGLGEGNGGDAFNAAGQCGEPMASLGIAPHHLPRPLGYGPAARIRFQTTAIGAVAVSPARHDRHVTDLAGGVGCAGQHASSADYAAAYAGADEHAHHSHRKPCLLRDRHSPQVAARTSLVTSTGSCSLSSSSSLERHFMPVKIGSEMHYAGGGVDLAGDAYADGGREPAAICARHFATARAIAAMISGAPCRASVG